MSDVFQRYVAVEFGIEGQAGKRHDGLRIGFKCSMNRSSKANKATINIWNLNAESLSILQEKRSIVRLIAGYQSQIPKLIFEGNVVKNGLKVERQGPDRLTSIELTDGGRRLSTARLNISFSRQVSLREVFELASKELGVNLGVINIQKDIQFPKGLALGGAANEFIDKLALATDSEWWIARNELNFIPAGSALSAPNNGPLYSVANGNLIGSPTKTDKGLVIKALLDPDMQPGRPFKVQSEQYNGNYIAHDVDFEGDSGFALPFYTIATGRPY